MDLLSWLREGDMRTTGASDRVVVQVLSKPQLFSQLVSGLTDPHPGVRMRAADAMEKISVTRPELLQPCAALLINIASRSRQQEVQWHMAQIFSRLDFTPSQQKRVFALLIQYIEQSKSRIVQVFSLQAVTDIAVKNAVYRPASIRLVKKLMLTGYPSIVSRGKKLLRLLQG